MFHCSFILLCSRFTDDEMLFFETRVQHTEIHNMNMSGVLYLYMILLLMNTCCRVRILCLVYVPLYFLFAFVLCGSFLFIVCSFFTSSTCVFDDVRVKP